MRAGAGEGDAISGGNEAVPAAPSQGSQEFELLHTGLQKFQAFSFADGAVVKIAVDPVILLKSGFRQQEQRGVGSGKPGLKAVEQIFREVIPAGDSREALVVLARSARSAMFGSRIRPVRGRPIRATGQGCACPCLG
jgi:hypothetical protein